MRGMGRVHRWNPIPGARFGRYLTSLRFLQGDRIRHYQGEVQRILSRTSPPSDESETQAVLVVGEVQSGKTASFTGLIAMAIDNGFRFIVVLAGTKMPLLRQTTSRLSVDLDLESRQPKDGCLLVDSPRKKDQDSITAHLKGNSSTTVIVTILKTAPSIRRVSDLLSDLKHQVPHLPVLIVDDEGDQAGLNIAHRQGRESATYAAILVLRASATNHSYVFYTATPQANLLIDIRDHLSPDSVVVMDAADSYVGGAELFGPGSTFYRSIPVSEIPVATNPTATDDPPRSLATSLSYFLLCLVYSREAQPDLLPMSMLVHPHSTMVSHQRYFEWLATTIATWRLLLQDKSTASALMTQFFIPARQELSRTIPESELSALDLSNDQVLRHEVDWALQSVSLRIMNSDRAWREFQEIDWRQSPGWIIIGGQKLERGFTLENLVVTYMPRGTGANTADTIQQRGRFFGHKQSYLALLRGWLNPDTRESFRSIVEHEDLYRSELRKIDETGEGLDEWLRKFVLDPNMSPTRAPVISVPHRRLNLAQGWRFKQERLFDPALPVLQDLIRPQVDAWHSNSIVFDLDNRNVDKGSSHHVAAVDMRELLQTLWVWPMHRLDREEFEVLLEGVAAFANRQSHLNAHVIFMGNLTERKRSADSRSTGPIERDWRVDNLHQGRSANYAGDSEMKTDDALTVQVHFVAPRKDKSDSKARTPVLALAIAWPLGFNRLMLLQTSP